MGKDVPCISGEGQEERSRIANIKGIINYLTKAV